MQIQHHILICLLFHILKFLIIFFHVKSYVFDCRIRPRVNKKRGIEHKWKKRYIFLVNLSHTQQIIRAMLQRKM